MKDGIQRVFERKQPLVRLCGLNLKVLWAKGGLLGGTSAQVATCDNVCNAESR